MKPINLHDYEEAARHKMPRMAFDYYASGANDEITLRENPGAFQRLSLQYRVLRDVSTCSLAASLLGHDLDLPLLLAPTAFHGLAHPEAERASVRAAGRLGTLMTLSTMSNTAMEDVTDAATGPVWFQLYVYKDRDLTAGLVRRAEAAGCRALVLTVDLPPLGQRERDVRNRFQMPPGLEAKNLLPAGLGDITDNADGSALASYTDTLFDPSLTWKDVTWLADLTDLPLVIKGIVHPDDARLAIDHGAKAVWVSNHGGRQLDTAVATVDVLPEIVEAVGDTAEVILDGGIRRGTDILKALALGARAVAVGRPLLWGLAVDGEDGVVHALGLLRRELEVAMGLCGARSLDELSPALIRRNTA